MTLIMCGAAMHAALSHRQAAQAAAGYKVARMSRRGTDEAKLSVPAFGRVVSHVRRGARWGRGRPVCHLISSGQVRSGHWTWSGAADDWNVLASTGHIVTRSCSSGMERRCLVFHCALILHNARFLCAQMWPRRPFYDVLDEMGPYNLMSIFCEIISSGLPEDFKCLLERCSGPFATFVFDCCFYNLHLMR